MPPEVSRTLGRLASFSFYRDPVTMFDTEPTDSVRFSDFVVGVYESLGRDTPLLLQMTDAEVYAETRKRVWDYPDKELVQAIFDEFVHSEDATDEAMEVFALQR